MNVSYQIAQRIISIQCLCNVKINWSKLKGEIQTTYLHSQTWSYSDSINLVNYDISKLKIKA